MEYSAPLFRIYNYDKIWTTFEPWNNQDPWHVMNPKASNPHLSSTSPSSRNSSRNIVLQGFAIERSIFQRVGFKGMSLRIGPIGGDEFDVSTPCCLVMKKGGHEAFAKLGKFLKDPIFHRNLMPASRRTASGFRLTKIGPRPPRRGHPRNEV